MWSEWGCKYVHLFLKKKHYFIFPNNRTLIYVSNIFFLGRKPGRHTCGVPLLIFLSDICLVGLYYSHKRDGTGLCTGLCCARTYDETRPDFQSFFFWGLPNALLIYVNRKRDTRWILNLDWSVFWAMATCLPL